MTKKLNIYTNTIILIFIISFNLSCSNEKTISDSKKEINQKSDKIMIKIKENISVDKSRIFPRLKANYGHKIYENDKKRSNTNKNLSLPEKYKPISINLFEDINLTFIADVGNQYVMLQQEFFDLNPEIKKDSLYILAVSNLMKEIGDKIEMRTSDDGIGMLTAGGNFEATIILISGTWEHLHEMFGDKIVFCIPANDLLFVCKEENKVATLKMKNLISKWFREDSLDGLISKGIYLRNHKDKSIKLIDYTK